MRTWLLLLLFYLCLQPHAGFADDGNGVLTMSPASSQHVEKPLALAWSKHVKRLSRQTASVVPKGNRSARASLIVTGDDVSRAFVKNQIVDYLNQNLTEKPGTRIQLIVPADLPAKLPEGEDIQVPVTAKIFGAGLKPTKEKISFNVRNKRFSVEAPASLMVSNNPEGFTHPCTLFHETLPDASPVQFLYHHDNRGNVPYLFEVDLVNNEDHPIPIHVMDGIAGPGLHELTVGAVAADRFFSALMHRLGRIVELNGETRHVLVLQKVRPGETVSGLLRLAPLSLGHPIVETRVRALGAGENSEAPVALNSNKSRGIFESPLIAIESEYMVGGDYAFISIGKDLILHEKDTAKPDLGNYGVLYNIHLTLTNPKPTPQTVHVMFSPQAGPAKGVFFVNGALVKVPIVGAAEVYPIYKAELAPNETRRVDIQTMPVGGSFYPVQIIAQP